MLKYVHAAVHGYVHKCAHIDLLIYVSSIQLRGDKNMVVTKPAEFRMNQKEYFRKAYGGEPIVISRPRNENVMLISEKDYKYFIRQKHLIQYYMKMKNKNIHDVDESDFLNALERIVDRNEEEHVQDISKRIGIAKGLIDDPENFDEWDEEIISMFTEEIQ